MFLKNFAGVEVSNFLLADKNLFENGLIYQLVNQNNFYQFFNCLISSNNSCKARGLFF